MQFREHRHLLEDSMKTIREIESKQDILDSVHSHLLDGMPGFQLENVTVKSYGYDARIGWGTHIVTVDNYGVVGFTDGPVPERPAEIHEQ